MLGPARPDLSARGWLGRDPVLQVREKVDHVLVEAQIFEKTINANPGDVAFVAAPKTSNTVENADLTEQRCGSDQRRIGVPPVRFGNRHDLLKETASESVSCRRRRRIEAEPPKHRP